MRTYASSRVKRKSFYRKSELQMFCWFPAAILVHQNGVPIWRLHTKLYKGAWNVSANNSETVGHKDLRLGQIVYILVFYNISFSWFLPLDGFQYIFLLRDSENGLYIIIISKASYWFSYKNLSLSKAKLKKYFCLPFQKINLLEYASYAHSNQILKHTFKYRL